MLLPNPSTKPKVGNYHSHLTFISVAMDNPISPHSDRPMLNDAADGDDIDQLELNGDSGTPLDKTIDKIGMGI